MSSHEIFIEELDEVIRQAESNPSRDGLEYSPEEEALLKKYYRKPGVTIRKLAKALNRSYSSVQSHVVRNGLSEEVSKP